jgi:hypothetical protein
MEQESAIPAITFKETISQWINPPLLPLLLWGFASVNDGIVELKNLFLRSSSYHIQID